MSEFSFNLVNEPWIPCIMPDGSRKEYGLKDVLLNAPKIREVYDPSPLVTVALHRLLLAILHRNFGPKDDKSWKALWQKGCWDREILEKYFSEWRGRFDLFDSQKPFYQTAKVPFEDYKKPSSKIIQELASGNNSTLFDHTSDNIPPEILPAEAARVVVAFQAFALGGLIKQGVSDKEAPLVGKAVVILKGDNLFQTLMLNFHHYNADGEVPFRSEKDKPCWERDEDTEAKERNLDGYLDLLTWQSRSIRLKPERVDGKLVVRYVALWKGYRFPKGFSLYKKETMVPFRKKKKAGPDEEPWSPVHFQEDRALWRDSLSLFQSVDEEQSRPKMMDWVSDLLGWEKENFLNCRVIPVDVLGLSNNKAKPLFWRHERLPLPLSYLKDEKLVDELKKALSLAEDVAISLQNILKKKMAKELGLIKGGDRKSENDILSNKAKRIYWSRLEVPFKELLVNLPNDKIVEYGDENQSSQWAKKIRNTAEEAFDYACDTLGTDARVLKTVTKFKNEFRTRVSGAVTEFRDKVMKIIGNPTG